MTGRESAAFDKLERNLFGEDGTGGAVGEIRGEVRGLRSDVDKIKGGVAILSVVGTVLAILEVAFRLVPAAFAGQ